MRTFVAGQTTGYSESGAVAFPTVTSDPLHPVQLRRDNIRPSDMMQSLATRAANTRQCEFTELAPAVWKVSSPNEGPTASILGGSHGNEPCGVFTVLSLLREYTLGKRTLSRGSVILAIGNEDAVMANTREVNHNLNRLFTAEASMSGGVEGQRAEILKNHLFREGSYLLDLHSTSQPSDPFVVVETEQVETASWVPVGKVLCAPKERFDEFLKGTAQRFAGLKGARAFTVECGQHDDHASINVAQHAAERFLGGVIDDCYAGILESESKQRIELEKVVYKDTAWFTFSRKFGGFDVVERGEVIGWSDLRQHIAEDRGVIIFPTDPAQVPIGGDLYFWGRLL